jgi:sucrose phosphorylase
VWTTFSADQLDLNYANPAVVQEIINVLLFYVAQGADFIRLDAIGYLWKEIGTSCLHLPQTHRMVQLFRAILDDVAPGVSLITETNVPHAENISYFGNGRNEAQLVYNFSLAPLILYTLHTGNAEAISHWAAGLTTPGEATTYFNFIASHDGIGLMPARGILTDAEIQALGDKTVAHGGRVSHKTNPDGSQSVYELNITLFDALNNPAASQPPSLQIDRFMVSQAIMLALAGVPGIYAHSLFGSSNNLAGAQQTGRARTINRQKWHRADLESALADPASRESLIFNRYRQLLRVRAAHPAFDPTGGQTIITANPSIFALLRTAPRRPEAVLCLHNVSSQPQEFAMPPAYLEPLAGGSELITGQTITLPPTTIHLAPYQVMWLAWASP